MSDYSIRTTPTFIDGLLMALNSIGDAALVVDGSDCVYEQLDRAMNKHDWFGGLKNAAGGMRLSSSGIEHVTALLGTEQALAARILEVARRDNPGIIFIAQLPLMKLMGSDMNSVARKIASEIKMPLVVLDPRRMNRDYLDGLALVFKGLAEILPRTDKIRKNRVAVVGYPFSRHEGEDIANTGFLRAAISALGLEPGPIWFSGCNSAEIMSTLESEYIAVLPHAASAIDALKLNGHNHVFAAPLPLGLSGSADFVQTLAEVSAREHKAEEYIEQQLARAVRRMEPIISRVFAGRRVAVVSDPLNLPALNAFMREIGFDIAVEILRRRVKTADDPGSTDAGAKDRLFDPSGETLNFHVSQAINNGGLDFIIGNSWEHDALASFDLPFFELDFPCVVRHSIADRPFWGFEGALNLADEWARLISESEYRHSRSAFRVTNREGNSGKKP